MRSCKQLVATNVATLIRACRRGERAPTRGGLTLVELLMVMGILTILASISLTAARSLMRGNKVSQAAILVKQYLQNAQIRAVTNGRPVAVFFDRVSPYGDTNSNPIPSNYTVTRLQFGEVFPPYMGDDLNASGILSDVPLVVMADGFTTRPADQHADMISIPFSQVASGFSVNGFLKPGDWIEFVGHEGKFRIESITRIPNDANPSQVQVHFFNPPSEYNDLLHKKVLRGYPLHNVYEVGLSASPTLLPISSTTTEVKFRIYRQPTKSLVGAITLPRGACVDLSLSGIGVADSGAGGGAYGLAQVSARIDGFATPADHSRVGIVFDGQGRVSYLMHEDRVNGTQLPPRFSEVNSNLYLMVGRADQVLPGHSSSNPNVTAAAQIAALQQAGGELPPSNLLDLENVWISCNPFTGEIKSSPLAAVDESTIEATIAELRANRDPTNPFANYVRQSRQLAISGVRN
ncbi:MAG: prepilin-type N-terminal cleavage/methylation domain-containing protein [Pirellulaceae bacterium]|nr:prepilin-type N-terminal cleavage/methylation domain-containing protein [Pirellulaceae bacterium]